MPCSSVAILGGGCFRGGGGLTQFVAQLLELVAQALDVLAGTVERFFHFAFHGLACGALETELAHVLLALAHLVLQLLDLALYKAAFALNALLAIGG